MRLGRRQHLHDGLRRREWDVVESWTLAAQNLDAPGFRRAFAAAQRLRPEPSVRVIYMYLEILISRTVLETLGVAPTRNELLGIADAIWPVWSSFWLKDKAELETVLLVALSFEYRQMGASHLGTLAATLGVLLREWRLDLNSVRPLLVRWIDENRADRVEVLAD